MKTNRYITNDKVTTLFINYKGEERECYIDTTDLALVQSVGFKFFGQSFNGIVYAMGHKHHDQLILMHRLILGITDSSIIVDHEDGNGLNNRRYNIRKATHSLNGLNLTRLSEANTSGYTGVAWSKYHSKWKAYITVDGHTHNLGHYTDKLEAAKVVSDFRKEVILAKTL